MRNPLVSMLLVTACASPSYVVRDGYVSRVTTDGADVPGAQVYPDDYGAGLVQAVDGNQAAVDRALTAQRRGREARYTAIASLACLGVDAIVARASEDSTGALPKGMIMGGGAVALACAVGLEVGAYLMLSANRYALEAMELYNAYPAPTQLDSQLGPRTATGSLRMRPD